MWTNYAHSIPACTVRCFSRAASTNWMQTEKLYITVRITEKCCRGICLPIPVLGYVPLPVPLLEPDVSGYEYEDAGGACQYL